MQAAVPGHQGSGIVARPTLINRDAPNAPLGPPSRPSPANGARPTEPRRRSTRSGPPTHCVSAVRVLPSGSSTDERCRKKCRKTRPHNFEKLEKCRKCRKIFEAKSRGHRPPCLRFTSENRSRTEVVETSEFFYTPFLHFRPKSEQNWDQMAFVRFGASRSESKFRIRPIGWAKMRKNAFSILQTSALPLGYRALRREGWTLQERNPRARPDSKSPQPTGAREAKAPRPLDPPPAVPRGPCGRPQAGPKGSSGRRKFPRAPRRLASRNSPPILCASCGNNV